MCFPTTLDPSKEQLENTICMMEGMEDYCPITGITFDLTKVPAELIGSYVQADIIKDTDPENPLPFDKVYYTKANFQLPVTTFQISQEQPCISPD